MNKILTFAINTCNNLNYLKLCVQSIQKNAYHRNCDILIVADGCTDGTNEWLLELSKTEKRLKYWIHKEKNWHPLYFGIGGSLNNLAEKCETEYFLPLHSDMYVGYHFDKELLRLCKENPKSVISSHRIEPDVFKNIKNNESKFKTIRPGTIVCNLDSFGYVYKDFNFNLFTEYSRQFILLNNKEVRKAEGAGGFIIRKEDWIDNDFLFAPASFEDFDLFIRMQLKNYQFILTSKSLIWHFSSRFGHFPTDDFSKTSDIQIQCEKENTKKWLTKWNKYPINDSNQFVSSVGMFIIDEKSEYR